MTPKQRFLTSQVDAGAHTRTVNDSSFVKAKDLCLLQLLSQMPETTDLTVAAANYQRLIGARLFVDLFMAFAEQPKPLPLKPEANLDHRI